MSRLLLVVIGVVVASFLLAGSPRERFTDGGTQQVIKSFLNELQYNKGRIMIGLYTTLLVNRSRRLRAAGNTTLDKDIARQMASQMAERSRWTDFEKWMKVSTTTQGTPMETNYIARTASLPVDPMNYLRFMNSLNTLYREELALLNDKKAPIWTRKEIDQGTAQEKYTVPSAVPTVVGANMEKYLVSHTEVMDSIWPKITTIGSELAGRSVEMNELLNIKEKMPNGFTMKIYVDFEESRFQKPLADVLKYMIDKQANLTQYDTEGKRIMSLEQAKIATTMEFVRLSRIDFTPWFVPIYRGKPGTYEDRFKTMIFDPNDYLRLGEFCKNGLEEQLKIVRDSLKPVAADTKEKYLDYGETDELLFETFVSPKLPPEDQPLIPQLRAVINVRFTLLGQIEDTFKLQIELCKKSMAEFAKIEKGAASGKFGLTMKNPFGDNESLPEAVSFKKNRLPVGDAL